MKTVGSFQEVISLVQATGIGFKKFIFRTNMSYDEIIDPAETKGSWVLNLPKDDIRDGILIIKFSDGDSYIGTLCLTQEDVEKADSGSCQTDPVTSYLFDIGPVFNLNLYVAIELKFGVYGGFDGTIGDAYVEVMPLANEKLKEWYEE